MKSLIGKKLKDVQLPGSNDLEFSTKDYLGKNIVLFFYPKDSTPGCTTESLEFSKLLAQFKKHDTLVFGISRDSIKSHENFKTKYKLAVDLLSDENEKVCKLFDVIQEKNMYGKKVMGVVRSTFVIDKTGTVVQEWRKVKAQGHAAEVLNYIKDNLS
jgi:peroxiredoxin Q/BCP